MGDDHKLWNHHVCMVSEVFQEPEPCSLAILSWEPCDHSPLHHGAYTAGNPGKLGARQDIKVLLCLGVHTEVWTLAVSRP